MKSEERNWISEKKTFFELFVKISRNCNTPSIHNRCYVSQITGQCQLSSNMPNKRSSFSSGYPSTGKRVENTTHAQRSIFGKNLGVLACLISLLNRNKTKEKTQK